MIRKKFRKKECKSLEKIYRKLKTVWRLTLYITFSAEKIKKQHEWPRLNFLHASWSRKRSLSPALAAMLIYNISRGDTLPGQVDL